MLKLGKFQRKINERLASRGLEAYKDSLGNIRIGKKNSCYDDCPKHPKFKEARALMAFLDGVDYRIMKNEIR
jgi:hypothetical protein